MIHSIRTFLEQFLDQTGNSIDRQLITQWHTIVGDLAHKMTLEKIDGSTLVIGVYDAAWMQELYLLSPLLIRKINKALGSQTVKALQFKRVVRKKENSGTKKTRPSMSVITPPPLTNIEKDALISLDSELANSLAEYRKRVHINK